MKHILLSLLTIGAVAFLAGCPQPVGTTYFLVSRANDIYSDSYVLPLTARADIVHARALATGFTASEPIVVARIAPGQPDRYTNLDVNGTGLPWSWHVAEFIGFADMTIEIYDGNPTFLEENFDWWMQNTGGYIGFWGYTVTRELTPGEVGATAKTGPVS